MTSLRSSAPPARQAPLLPPASPVRIAPVRDDERGEFARLVDDDPYVNAVLASRLAAFRTVDPRRFGGTISGVRDGRCLVAAAFDGGTLLPVGGRTAHWRVLAEHFAGRPRGCTSIVGRAEAVATMWHALEPHWGAAREFRTNQPLLLIERGHVRVTPDPRVCVMTPDVIDRYLPAAAAMFTEELGISPFGNRLASYRRRVESLLASGRAFGVMDAAGEIAFKADIGALSARTCQLHGVWVRPDLRGRGLGTAALAGVLNLALRLAPTVSLYVNSFNTPARRMYATLGMKQVATLSTVLF